MRAIDKLKTSPHVPWSGLGIRHPLRVGDDLYVIIEGLAWYYYRFVEHPAHDNTAYASIRYHAEYLFRRIKT